MTREPSLHLSLRNFFQKPPLSIHLLTMNMVILLLIFPIVGLVLQQQYHTFRSDYLQQHLQQMRTGLERQISSMMQSMRATALFALGNYEFFLLQEQITEVSVYDPAITYLTMMDTGGNAVVHSKEEKILTILEDPMDLKARTLLADLSNAPQVQEGKIFFLTNEKTIEPGETPILEALIPLYSSGQLWGGLRCGYNLTELQGQMEQSRTQWDAEISRFNRLFLMAMGSGAMLAAIVAWLFARFILRSTTLLDLGVQRVATGDLKHRINQILPACREFCTLSDGFNLMTANLAMAQQELDRYSHSLEEEVRARTRELQNAQANLISQAREAGMAEMAIGVLHNIGNAITPAKVDVELLLSHLSHSPMKNDLGPALLPIEDIINDNQGLEDNERSRMLGILKLLPRVFVEEFERICTTLNKVRNKHNHIEEIIRLQMRYARLSGEEELIDISRVVTDALAILADSLKKRAISVTTNLPALPQATMEHARLMQIVINLIKNGYESIEGCPDKRPGTLRITSSQAEQHLLLSIKDNGMGFAPGAEEKIFTYGYSTKEHGSGFGLHSAANFLIAQGGSIRAQSEGSGLGAEFIVSLPIHSHPEEQHEEST